MRKQVMARVFTCLSKKIFFNFNFISRHNDTKMPQGIKIVKNCIKKEGLKPSLSVYLPWMRFERMTYCLEGSCSIQLSYQGLFIKFSLIDSAGYRNTLLIFFKRFSLDGS